MASKEEVTTTKGDSLGKRRHESPDPEAFNEDGSPETEAHSREGSVAKRMKRGDEYEAESTTLTTGSSSPSGPADVALPSPVEMPNTSRKRVKLDPASVRAPCETPTVQTSPLLTIPPEIFSEIVLSTSSPIDALALSLTCKALFASLSLPQSSFIWAGLRRDVGRNFDWGVAALNISGRPMAKEEMEKRLVEMYGMPDWQKIETEGQGWKGMLFGSEQEFLGFAYGIGVGAGSRMCETCGDATPYGKPYLSYALRISLCDRRECKRSFITTHLTKIRHPLGSEFEGHQMHDQLRAHLEPQLEREFRGASREAPIVGTDYAGAHFVYRKDVSRLERLINSTLEMEKEQRDEVLGREATRMARWSKLCDELAAWRRKTKDYYFKNKRANELSLHDLATENQWNQEDILNCTSYGAYHRHKNHLMERVSGMDIAALLPTVTSQMEALIAKRTRGAQDAVYHTFREQIISYHKHLVKLSAAFNSSPTSRSSAPKTQLQRDVYPIVPALSAFRELEVMRMLQTTHVELPASTSVMSISHPMHNPLYSFGLHQWGEYKRDDSKSWRENVKKIVKQGDIGRSLRGDKVLGVIVRDQVGKWVQNAREGLGKVLAEKKECERGVSEADVEAAASAERRANAEGGGSTSKADGGQTWTADGDLDHFTTRFRCKKCAVYDSEYATDECLDFKGACTHECTINGVKGPRKVKWNVDNFERDEKAIAVLEKIESAARDKFSDWSRGGEIFLGIRTPPYAVKSEAEVWKGEVICMSCEVPVLMTTKDAVGHSHRHDDMQIQPVWSRVGASVPGDVVEVLQAYREFGMVKKGKTKEMLSKSWKPKPSKTKPKEGGSASKKAKKGKGKAGVKPKEDTKGKGKEISIEQVLAEFEEGQAAGDGGDNVSKEDEKVFSCRHCYNSQVLSAMRAATTAKHLAESEAQPLADAGNSIEEASWHPLWGGTTAGRRMEVLTKAPTWMGWNGMRSHVKAKHGIPNIRDEDYFMKKPGTRVRDYGIPF